MNDVLKPGFTYTFDLLDRHGRVIEREVVHNLIPVEGLAFMLGALFKNQTVPSGWYIAPYEGNYTPTLGDTAAAMPALATECTAYAASLRAPFAPGAVSGTTIDNGASSAEFVFTEEKTLYGGFMTSSPNKGATTGILLSAVRFGSPKAVGPENPLRVTAGFTFASA